MGYSTTCTLQIKNGDCDCIAELREFSGGAQYALNKNGDTNESCKWYEHEKDMRAFSKKYPDTVFQLNGWGEDHEDIWRKFFQNGRVQIEKATITFGEFDPNKLE